MALIKIKILPTKKVLSKLIDPDFKIKVAAPTIPKKIPNNFLIVIFSLIIIAEKIITNIGLTVIIIAALIGVVKFSPSKKNS